jgi:Domain of unknown function (DUF397)
LIGENVPVSTQDRDGWFTSSYTNATGSCVEVKLGLDAVLVRDSKDRRAVRPIIAVPSASWVSFLDNIR